MYFSGLLLSNEKKNTNKKTETTIETMMHEEVILIGFECYFESLGVELNFEK